MENKVCNKCGEEKPMTTEYFLFRNDTGKFRNDCKSCKKLDNKNYYQNNREKIIENNTQYAIDNAEIVKERKTKYYLENKETISEKRKLHYILNKQEHSRRNKLWREKNSEKVKSYKKQYYRENKVRLLELNKIWRLENYKIHKKRRSLYHKNYYQTNKTKVKEKNTLWYRLNKNYKISKDVERNRMRYKNDNFYRMKKIVRSRVSCKIKNKSMDTQDILGCNWNTFRTHIEKQFVIGMNWDNQGEWHLDHIIPLASAKTKEDLIRLNHYTNFQPLWAKDNLSKGDKLPEEWLNEYQSN